MLGIKNKYEAFCLDEVAEYVYHKWMEKTKNQEDLKNLMNRHADRKTRN